MTTTDLHAAIDEMAQRIARLESVVGWYAEPSNWKREVRNVGPRINWTNSPAAFDKGGMARLALMEGAR